LAGHRGVARVRDPIYLSSGIKEHPGADACGLVAKIKWRSHEKGLEGSVSRGEPQKGGAPPRQLPYALCAGVKD